jgi:hypothetical protein
MRFHGDERSLWQQPRCGSLLPEGQRCAAQSLNFSVTPEAGGEMESEEAG